MLQGQGRAAIHDMVVRSVVFEIKPRGGNRRLAVQEAVAALRHVEIAGNVQMERGGLGLVWNGAGPNIKKLIRHRQEEMVQHIFLSNSKVSWHEAGIHGDITKCL